MRKFVFLFLALSYMSVQAQVKKTKAESEHCKVSIRTTRRDANEHIKKDGKGMPEDVVKDIEDRIQKMTDQFIAVADKHLEAKEKEIMTI